MRRVFVVLLLCLCSFGANGQKWRPGQPPPHAKPGVDYPIKIHVYGIHLRDEYYGSGQRGAVVYADAIMGGKKIELCFNLEPIPWFHTDPVLPGDYRARLLKDSPKKSPYKTSDSRIDQQYEFVMPDGTLLPSTVTGISE
jgi:hypothetical protein